MTPYFTLAWSFVRDRRNQSRKVRIIKFRIPQPKRGCTWCYIGAALVLLVGLILSLVLVSGSNSNKPARCYATGTFDGLSIYLQTNRTTMQSCASAAKGSGLTNLSSLPAGVQMVCANDTVTVFMRPDQLATVRDLGINPATICS